MKKSLLFALVLGFVFSLQSQDTASGASSGMDSSAKNYVYSSQRFMLLSGYLDRFGKDRGEDKAQPFKTIGLKYSVTINQKKLDVFIHYANENNHSYINYLGYKTYDEGSKILIGGFRGALNISPVFDMSLGMMYLYVSDKSLEVDFRHIILPTIGFRIGGLEKINFTTNLLDEEGFSLYNAQFNLPMNSPNLQFNFGVSGSININRLKMGLVYGIFNHYYLKLNLYAQKNEHLGFLLGLGFGI